MQELEFYKKTHSLREVSKRTGIPVSTLWYRLSKKDILDKKTKVTSLAENNEKLKGLYIGIWIGDGSRYHNNGYITKIHVHKKDTELITLFQKVIWRLFRKNVRIYSDRSNSNSAALKIHSEFIYNFPERFAKFEKKKSKSIRLRAGLKKEFLDGVLLGLMLTDGYLKDRAIFATVSPRLSNQFEALLRERSFSPSTYIQRRKHKGWNDLYLTRLTINESKILKQKMNGLLNEIKSNHTFDELKRYKEKMGPP